jgi:hypothetical protein
MKGAEGKFRAGLGLVLRLEEKKIESRREKKYIYIRKVQNENVA